MFKITVAGELTTLVAFGGSPTAEVQPYAPLFWATVISMERPMQAETAAPEQYSE